MVDPALPVDPDNERYSLGVREWANERMCELADERRRREVDGRRRRANMLREGFSE